MSEIITISTLYISLLMATIFLWLISISKLVLFLISGLYTIFSYKYSNTIFKKINKHNQYLKMDAFKLLEKMSESNDLVLSSQFKSFRNLKDSIENPLAEFIVAIITLFILQNILPLDQISFNVLRTINLLSLLFIIFYIITIYLILFMIARQYHLSSEKSGF